MGDNSSIEWTDATWNPVRGCSIVSKGCTNCYAMRQAHRTSGHNGAYEGLTKLTKGGPVWTGEIRQIDKLLDLPLTWARPRRIFVNSMSDLFHEGVHGDFIDQVLDVVKRCNHLGRGHTFQVLTKRADRMMRFMRNYKPIDNLWLGVSVEDQAAADERIPLLLQTPAAVRWISAEPLLGPIDLRHARCDAIRGNDGETRPMHYHGEFCGYRLDWVVAGGESGPGARPMHPDWARSLRDQCASAGVPFFFKQWGGFRIGEVKPGDNLLRWQDGKAEWYGDHADIKYSEHWLAYENGTGVVAWPASKKSTGRQLDGRMHDEYPT